MSKPALELGSLIHAALADWTNKLTDDTGRLLNTDEIFALHAERRLNEVTTQYVERVGVEPSDVEMQPLYESIGLGLEMCKNYQQRWKVPLGSNMVFAMPEQEIVVDIPGTEHRCTKCWSGNNDIYLNMSLLVNPYCQECGGTGTAIHKLRMILDGLIQDKNGTYLVLERKTYDKRPSEDLLTNNDQFMGYTWGVMQIDGIDKVGGVAYDGLWKRAKPPRGSTFEDLFIRTVIRYTRAELEDWERQLVAVVNEMANDPAIYPYRRWEGCWDCGFLKLCQAQSKGEDIDFMMKEMYQQRPDNRPIISMVKG